MVNVPPSQRVNVDLPEDLSIQSRWDLYTHMVSSSRKRLDHWGLCSSMGNWTPASLVFLFVSKPPFSEKLCSHHVPTCVVLTTGS